MKKFTHLDEDLIKENAEVAAKFNNYYKECLEILDEFKIALDDFAIKQTNEPRNWGYVGSISHVHEKLTETLQFLKGEE